MKPRRLILTKLLDLYRQQGANSFVIADQLLSKAGDPEFLAAVNQLLGERLILAIDAGGSMKGRLAIGLNAERAHDVETELKSHDVFLSYSTADTLIAEEIAAGIRGRGFTVFLSHQTIKVGPKWEDQIADAARSCRLAVLLLSEDSRNSDWVRYEIGALWALGKHVAPALVGLLPSDLPELLRKYQGRPASSPIERKVFCDEVARLLTEH